MKFLLAALSLLAFFSRVSAVPHQHAVLSVVATTKEQVDMLAKAADTDHELDFWTHPRLNGETDVMVPWQRLKQLRQQWTHAGMQVKVAQADVAQLIRNVEAENRRLQPQRLTPKMGTTLDHSSDYRSYQQYITDLKYLKEQFGPSLIRFDDSGENPSRSLTIEGRIMHFFEIGADMDNTPVIMLEVQIHAREWVTSAGTFYMVDWLLTNYGKQADATFLMDNFHLVIIPVANPDGYEYSRAHPDNRLWRKNRRYIGGVFNCYGVDLNRNFNASWVGGGFCSSTTYPGSTYNSEPETQAVVSIYKHFQDKMIMYAPVHCYSQIILLPWSYQSTAEPINTWHTDVGNAMAQAMTDVAGKYHAAGTAYATIGYSAAGTSGDWGLLQNKDTPRFASIAYEMRPATANDGGFVLDASHIVPTGKEMLASLLAFANLYMDTKSA